MKLASIAAGIRVIIAKGTTNPQVTNGGEIEGGIVGIRRRNIRKRRSGNIMINVIRNDDRHQRMIRIGDAVILAKIVAIVVPM